LPRRFILSYFSAVTERLPVYLGSRIATQWQIPLEPAATVTVSHGLLAAIAEALISTTVESYSAYAP